MEKGTTQLKHTLVYGLITGGIVSIYQLLLYIFGMMNNDRMLKVGGILFIMGAFISVRQYRNHLQGGLISYGRAFGVAIWTFITAGFIWSIYEYFLYKFLAPGLLAEKLAQTQEDFLRRGWDKNKVDAFFTLSESTPLTNAIGYFFYTALMGAILSLLIAAILKREKNPLLNKE